MDANTLATIARAGQRTANAARTDANSGDGHVCRISSTAYAARMDANTRATMTPVIGAGQPA